MKYREKPVEVEAFQFDGDLINKYGEYYVPGWAEKAYKDGVMYCVGQGDLYIKTLEGEHLVNVGDYIIRGVGEIYPCKPDIFEVTYEPVLKPCPFCGGEAVIRTIAPHTHHFIDMPAYEGGTFIECSGCTCAVSGKTNKEAIGAWNRRA